MVTSYSCHIYDPEQLWPSQGNRERAQGLHSQSRKSLQLRSPPRDRPFVVPLSTKGRISSLIKNHRNGSWTRHQEKKKDKWWIAVPLALKYRPPPLPHLLHLFDKQSGYPGLFPELLLLPRISVTLPISVPWALTRIRNGHPEVGPHKEPLVLWKPSQIREQHFLNKALAALKPEQKANWMHLPKCNFQLNPEVLSTWPSPQSCQLKRSVLLFPTESSSFWPQGSSSWPWIYVSDFFV